MEAPLLQVPHRSPMWHLWLQGSPASRCHACSSPGSWAAGKGQPRIWTRWPRRAFSAFEGCMPGLGLLHLWFYLFLDIGCVRWRNPTLNIGEVLFLMNEWSPQRFLLLTLSTHPFFSFFCDIFLVCFWCLLKKKTFKTSLYSIYIPQIWDSGFSTYWPIW